MTPIPGFKIGHHTDLNAITGCTVILCPANTKASCEVRGASPGSRELALLAPDKSMKEIHAIALTGGSAFGLGVADGVMKWLEEQKTGYETPWAKVPIVPTAVIFDLNVGSSSVRPGAEAGYAACKAAKSGAVQEGNVGVGTGATVGKWKGIEYWMKGGFGTASSAFGDLMLWACGVVNAVGDVIDENGKILAGSRGKNGEFFGQKDPLRAFERGEVLDRTNTTLVVFATNGNFNKSELHRISQRMHDGVARSIIPAHTSYDGDVAFALSCGTVSADFDFVAEAAARLTAESVRRAVKAARSIQGIPGLGDHNF